MKKKYKIIKRSVAERYFSVLEQEFQVLQALWEFTEYEKIPSGDNKNISEYALNDK